MEIEKEVIEPGLSVGIGINVFDRKENEEILVKSLMKICKYGDFQLFRPGKKSSRKLNSVMFWALLTNTHLCAKVRKN